MDQHYIKAIKYVIIGYFFLLLSISIDGINIFPKWLGYIFLYRSLVPISQYTKSALLLRPILILIAIYDFICWLLTFFGISFSMYVITIIITSLDLYLDFQLLTNIADIAKRQGYHKVKYLYYLRNIKIIFLTLTILFTSINHYLFLFLAIILNIVSCIIAFVFIIVLYHYLRFVKSYRGDQ